MTYLFPFYIYIKKKCGGQAITVVSGFKVLSFSDNGRHLFVGGSLFKDNKTEQVDEDFIHI